MPLGRMLAAIIVLGIGLALVHPLLGFVGVLALLGRIYWRYFSWLQCDSCSRFFFGGQLSSSPRATIPWTKSDIQNLALRVAVIGGILLLVFLPMRYVEQTAKKNCAAECALAGRDGQAFFNRCNCVPRAK